METSHLSLFLPPFSEPEQLLVRQDVIYVGGGSTANMLAVWRLHGIDQILRNCLDNGAILYGSSAGGICWFESGLTLSFDGSLRPLHNGLGLIAGATPSLRRADQPPRPWVGRCLADGRESTTSPPSTSWMARSATSAGTPASGYAGQPHLGTASTCVRRHRRRLRRPRRRCAGLQDLDRRLERPPRARRQRRHCLRPAPPAAASAPRRRCAPPASPRSASALPRPTCLA